MLTTTNSLYWLQGKAADRWLVTVLFLILTIVLPSANVDLTMVPYITVSTRKIYISEEKYAYGVVNQPMGDSFAPSAPVMKISEDKYGVINQPISDSFSFSTSVRKISEETYGVVNQPMSGGATATYNKIVGSMNQPQ